MLPAPASKKPSGNSSPGTACNVLEHKQEKTAQRQADPEEESVEIRFKKAFKATTHRNKNDGGDQPKDAEHGG